MFEHEVLVACEESGVLTAALRARGVNAFSCDIVPTRGPHPKYHYTGDVRKILHPWWSAVIAFPPCDHLSKAGTRYWAEKRADGRQAEALAFFMEFVECEVPFVAIENPIGYVNTAYRKPDQIVQPWQFGHAVTKATCLWLKGFQPLKPTDIVTPVKGWVESVPGGPRQKRNRSATFAGIANAMADQWFKGGVPNGD